MKKLKSKFCFNSLNIYIYTTDGYKTQEVCDRVVYEDSSLKLYSPNKYITHKMCNEAVDGSLAAL